MPGQLGAAPFSRVGPMTERAEEASIPPPPSRRGPDLYGKLMVVPSPLVETVKVPLAVDV